MALHTKKEEGPIKKKSSIIGLVSAESSNNRLLFITSCVLKTTKRLLSLFMLIRRMKPFVDPALRPIEPPIDDDPSEPYLDKSDIPADSFEVSESSSHAKDTNVTAEKHYACLPSHSQELSRALINN